MPLPIPPPVDTPPGPGVQPPLLTGWVLPEDLADCVDCDTTVDLAEVCAATSEILFILSGRRFAQRRLLIRPHRRIESSQAWWMTWGYVWGAAVGYGYAGWGTASTADPDHYALDLNGPVQTLNAVKVDGVTLTAADYALFDGHTLIRIDPTQTTRLAWPHDQRRDVPDTEPGTFSVDYTWGQAVPHGGQIAARALACNIAKYLSGSDCELSSTVAETTRQGIRQKRLDAIEFIEKNKTGVRLTDLWLGAVNPRGLRRPATIMSPDTLQESRVS